ncbi:MAG: sulfide/dihydroorotate dehydrogenase-like FAD/NAD-binding protein [Phycisphaerae bacterium]|nr:sulfide/dihydroorotate dehydrogenase-like FAD/NAD-binding protein [Phycisphaerae bacterium]
MFEVISNEVLTDNVHRMVIKAPRIAKSRQAGQFVIVRSDADAERIPLTIADADVAAGTVTLIIQALGDGTRRIVGIEPPDGLKDVAGPLGLPTHIEKWGKVACVGGGVGTAVLYPLAAAAAEAGNEVTAVIGGRTEPLVILRNELAEFCDDVLVATEDGSLGTKGFVTAVLQELLDDEAKRPAAVFAVGPVGMMKAVAEQTRPYGIKTLVSLNPIMVDGTGMCGGCRVTVGGEAKFACVDGPEFDGHLVDFDELASRQATYEKHEKHEACRLAQQLNEMKRGQK